MNTNICPNNCFTLHESFLPRIDDILYQIPFVKKGQGEQLSNIASVFDIEATSFYDGKEKRCCMYAWVFGMNGKCIRGRTWKEFLEIIRRIKKAYDITPRKRFIIYVHNLSYEFQFLRKYFKWKKVFSVDTRKPIYAITEDGIEFRCSYLLSGYSLEKLGENLTTYKVKKMVGDLDYSLMRHSETPLTEKEWNYILHDGLVVMSFIQQEIEHLGSIAKIPLTQTGYVRNACRENCLKGNNRWYYSKLMKSLTLTPEDYLQLKRTYMGGFTHANIQYVNKITANVHSYDFTSSYPAVMVSEMYPMSKAFPTEIESIEQFNRYLRNFCCMFDVTFHDIRSKVEFENYISISRCRDVGHYIVNNGRLIEADTITLSLTEQDYFIIKEMYDWDSMDIFNFKYFYKNYLPKDFILSILEFYGDKTKLKGVKGKEREYLKGKEKANASYGMCVTDPCKDENTYDNVDSWGVTKADICTLIDRYNKNRNRFLYYPWGVWVTAYARRNLFTGIFEFRDDYLYSDTDSVKVLNIEKHKDYINNYNKTVTKKIRDCLKYREIPFEMSCPKTIKGIPKPLGVWDYEGKYDKFKTLGAKRYMYTQNGELNITIAGVSKSMGLEYLKHEYKTTTNIFEHFTEGLYFPPHYDRDGVDENGSGKLCHTYLDKAVSGTMIDYMGNRGEYCEYSGVHMENTDYTLSLTEEFKRLILGHRSSDMVYG